MEYYLAPWQWRDDFSQVTVEVLTAPSAFRRGSANRSSKYQYEATIDSGSSVRGWLFKVIEGAC